MSSLPIAMCLFFPSVLVTLAQSVTRMLATYLSRFSSIADNKINCGPVLTWMEVSPGLPPAVSVRESLGGHDPINLFQYFIRAFNI